MYEKKNVYTIMKKINKIICNYLLLNKTNFTS
mgnify:CR=1 FL=1